MQHRTPMPSTQGTPTAALVEPPARTIVVARARRLGSKHGPDTLLTHITPRRGDTAAHRFTLTLLERGYAPGTRLLYDRYLGRWFTWCANHRILIWEAVRTDVETYTRQLIDDGLTASTVNSALAPVRMLYTLAHADGIIPRNPTVHAWRPKIHRNRRLPWLDHVSLVRWIKISATISPRHHAVGVLAGMAALRATEIAGLQVEDWAGIQDGHRVLRFVGKGSKPATMPLTVPLIRALDAVTDGRTTGPLIPALDGGQLSRHGVATLVATICRHADVPIMSPHGIRRSVITNALDAGIPPRRVQRLARHESMDTTLRYDCNGDSLDQHALHPLSAWLA